MCKRVLPCYGENWFVMMRTVAAFNYLSVTWPAVIVWTPQAGLVSVSYLPIELKSVFCELLIQLQREHWWTVNGSTPMAAKTKIAPDELTEKKRRRHRQREQGDLLIYYWIMTMSNHAKGVEMEKTYCNYRHIQFITIQLAQKRSRRTVTRVAGDEDGKWCYLLLLRIFLLVPLERQGERADKEAALVAQEAMRIKPSTVAAAAASQEF